jgi:hypothetical protein
MVTTARAHHYLPVFYLKGFASETSQDKGFLWVYEKGKPPRRSKPENEAHQRNLYSYEDERGERRNLEQALSQIESAVAPFFRAVENGYYDFHPDDWEGFTYFIALMWLRGPSGRDFVNGLSSEVMKSEVKKHAQDAERFSNQYQRFLDESGTETRLSAEEMRAFIFSDEWEVKQKSHGYTLRKMFEGVPIVGSILKDKCWEVLVSKDEFFCTSNHPVVTLLPDGSHQATIGAGFGWPDVEVYFPLNKRQCLVLKGYGRNGARQVRSVRVRAINKILMVGAQRFFYGPDKNTAIEKLFNKIGCKSVLGKSAFMREQSPTTEYVYRHK